MIFGKGTKNESNFDNTKEFEELALKGNIDEMFQKLQEIQLNQMLALNQKQQKEQKNLLKTLENDQIRLFKKLQKSFPDANKVETTDTSSPITTVVQTPNFDLNVSLSNQTLYLTTNSSFEENIGTAVYDNLSTSKDNIASMLLYDKPVSPEHFYLNDKQVNHNFVSSSGLVCKLDTFLGLGRKYYQCVCTRIFSTKIDAHQ